MTYLWSRGTGSRGGGLVRDGGGRGGGGSSRRQVAASYQAVCKAVSSLHRLDDFTMESIGSGFFSEVFKVVHVVTKQVMVLKMNVSPPNRPNVLREIQLMNRLSHPNVLRLLGVCVHNAQLHGLVEYINGGSLEELLADRESRSMLSWSVRIRLACDIAKALKYLHTERVMHRDLTSKNILIKRENEERISAVVGDLGLACSIPDPLSEKALPVVGSPYWMAPECIAGKRYSEKADVFSYGIVLCEMVALVEADPDVLPRTKKFGVDYVAFSKMVADCPLHLLHLTFTCCQIDPKKRPTFGEIVSRLEEMKSIGQMAVILADLSRFGGVYNCNGPGIDRILLERILDWREPKRTRSDELSLFGPYEALASPSSATSSSSSSSGAEAAPLASRRFVPVTPLMVGKVMSRDDAHYAPHRDNPFTKRFRDANAKVIDGLFDSLIDSFDSALLSPRGTQAPPATPNTPNQMLDETLMVGGGVGGGRRLRRCHSLPASPRDFSRRFDFVPPVADDDLLDDADVRGGGGGGGGGGSETSSEYGGSSADSAVECVERGSEGNRGGRRNRVTRPGGATLRTCNKNRNVSCCHSDLVTFCLNCVMLGGGGGSGATEGCLLDDEEDSLAAQSCGSSLSLEGSSSALLSPSSSSFSGHCSRADDSYRGCATSEVLGGSQRLHGGISEAISSQRLHGGPSELVSFQRLHSTGRRWEDDRWRSQERFKALMRLWEAHQFKQGSGGQVTRYTTPGAATGGEMRDERRKTVDSSSSSCVMKSVEELRRVWENVIRLHVASCCRYSTTSLHHHHHHHHLHHHHPRDEQSDVQYERETERERDRERDVNKRVQR